MVVLSPTLGRTGLGRGGVSEGTSPVLEEVEAALLKQLSAAGMTVVPPEDAKMRMIGKASLLLHGVMVLVTATFYPVLQTVRP